MVPWMFWRNRIYLKIDNFNNHNANYENNSLQKKWSRLISATCIGIYNSNEHYFRVVYFYLQFQQPKVKNKIGWGYKRLKIEKFALNQKVVDKMVKTIWSCVQPKNCYQKSNLEFSVKSFSFQMGVSQGECTFKKEIAEFWTINTRAHCLINTDRKILLLCFKRQKNLDS